MLENKHNHNIYICNVNKCIPYTYKVYINMYICILVTFATLKALYRLFRKKKKKKYINQNLSLIINEHDIIDF